MPKGRICNPSTDKDGIWFSHVGHDDGRPLYREKSTMTGRMLCEPFRPDTGSYPPQPPSEYVAKDVKNFKHCNPFSAHDNREHLANDATVFGSPEKPRTMGRRMAADGSRDQQRTDRDMLYHFGRKTTCHDYNTIYSDNYRGCQSAVSLRQCGGGGILTPNCRKFPRQYPSPKPGAVPFNTHGCKQDYGDMADAPDRKGTRENGIVTIDYVDGPYHRLSCRLTTEDLGRTQHQYVKDCGCLSEAWKYAYRGIPRCYPSSAYTRINGANSAYPGWFLHDGVTPIPAGRRCIARA